MIDIILSQNMPRCVEFFFPNWHEQDKPMSGNGRVNKKKGAVFKVVK
jgi:hypothetical protein